MRVYARTPEDVFGKRQWIVIETDAAGYNDYVYFVALAQAILLNLGESPFYAKDGIPARASVRQQIEPDFAVARLQSKYSKYFVSLIIQKMPTDPADPKPTYNIKAIRADGSLLQLTIGY